MPFRPSLGAWVSPNILQHPMYGLGIGTLIALSFIQDPEVIHEPQRCPATETWCDANAGKVKTSKKYMDNYGFVTSL